MKVFCHFKKLYSNRRCKNEIEDMNEKICSRLNDKVHRIYNHPQALEFKCMKND